MSFLISGLVTTPKKNPWHEFTFQFNIWNVCGDNFLHSVLFQKTKYSFLLNIRANELQ